MVTTLLQLAGVFGMISLLSVGGGNATLPEIKRLTITQYHWVNSRQFLDVYALGQLAPGPSSLYVAAIGYSAAGVAGALVAEFSLLLPACLLMFVVSRIWNRFSASPWQHAIKSGFAPVTIGLMLAGTHALATSAIRGPATAAICVVIAALLLFRHINPALLILAGGAAGWIAIR